MQSRDTSGTTDDERRTKSGPDERRGVVRRRSKSADEIAAAYADVADGMARWQSVDRLIAGRYRRRQFGAATGRVLDVACGTGQNFRYLESAEHVVGVDISDAVLAHASDELADRRVEGTVHQMDAQALAFPDDSFDTVVSSFSTCTFPDPVVALREMDRVCAPDGQILLLEHDRSDLTPLARLQDWRARAQYEQNGCRLNHEPLRTVESAGLTVERVSSGLLGFVTAIDVAPSRTGTTTSDDTRRVGAGR